MCARPPAQLQTSAPQSPYFTLYSRQRYEGAFTVLDLDHAPAPWLLGDAALVSSYNTAYERVYPDALSELGIPTAALADRKAWEQWL
ncbi:hypothetical protein [Streptomyces ardesiacus]|uniref:hypothetical protein n=1 Tax=Streptomyces ardesiacus TaxID=285564 RepID=UPI0006E427D1|nr:hypothetical protein [Streptomyces sp. NBRC 110030]